MSVMGVSVRTLQDWEQGLGASRRVLRLRFCALLSNTRKSLVSFTDQSEGKPGHTPNAKTSHHGQSQGEASSRSGHVSTIARRSTFQLNEFTSK